MHSFGDVVLSKIQFSDTFEVKRRPVLVLFKEHGNIVVAGITSNLDMKGIKLTKKEGAMKESIIKLNYIFTISEEMVEKFLFKIPKGKKEIIKRELFNKFE